MPAFVIQPLVDRAWTYYFGPVLLWAMQTLVVHFPGMICMLEAHRSSKVKNPLLNMAQLGSLLQCENAFSRMFTFTRYPLTLT